MWPQFFVGAHVDTSRSGEIFMDIARDSGTQARIDTLPRRRRTARAIANDLALREAAVALIAESGWDALTFGSVAERAGLTVGAVYGRAESKAELGTDLWTSVLRQSLSDHFTLLHSTIDNGSAPELAKVHRTWSEPAPELQAATELLIAAMFDEDLGEVIRADMADMVGGYCSLEDGRPAASAASSALAMGAGFGRVLAGTAGVASAPSTKASAQREIDMSRSKGRGKAIPKGPEFMFMRTSSTDDPHQDLLQMAALNVVGRVGYRRATVARICRTAQVSSGSMFARYDSKASLVVSAADSLLVPPGEETAAFADIKRAHGPAVAKAAQLRRSLDPAKSPQWALRLELARVASHETDLQPIDLIATPDQQFALGMGLMAAYGTGIDQLPFVVPFSAAAGTK